MLKDWLLTAPAPLLLTGVLALVCTGVAVLLLGVAVLFTDELLTGVDPLLVLTEPDWPPEVLGVAVPRFVPLVPVVFVPLVLVGLAVELFLVLPPVLAVLRLVTSSS